MLQLEEIKSILKAEKKELASLGIKDIGIFGSYIRGEASKRIPDDYKANYPLILWKVMAGMRDMIRLRSSPVRSGTAQGPARCVM